MVYLGKPSPACVHCRRRKLRCDLQRDRCGQCARADLVCSGYRDPTRLRIRDESQAIRQKVLGVRDSPVAQAPVPSMQISWVDVARSAFFRHNVSGFTDTYDVLVLIHQTQPAEAHLSASVDAASLAFFCFLHPSAPLSHRARAAYLRALPLVNQAISAPTTVTDDATLLAVLLLDFFEKVVNNNPRSTESWMSHVRGALDLVRLRGRAQFQSYIGRRLSSRLLTNMLISCVAADALVPPGLLRMRDDLEPFLETKDLKWHINGFVMRYTYLRASSDEGTLTLFDLLRQAKELDSQVYEFYTRLPKPGRRASAPTDRALPSDIIPASYDVYPNLITARTFNFVRLIRILLNILIRTTYQDITSEDIATSTSYNVHVTASIIDTMADEICASAPQSIGAPALSALHSMSPSPSHKVNSQTLLFPLYIAATYARPEANVLSRVQQQLKIMSDVSGIRGARVVADLLQSPIRPNPWSVYALLGSYAFAA